MSRHVWRWGINFEKKGDFLGANSFYRKDNMTWHVWRINLEKKWEVCANTF